MIGQQFNMLTGPSGSSAVEKAKNFSGKYAWLFTTYGSNSSWYCSKLVSRAYYDASDDGFRLGYRYPDDTYVDRNTKNLAFSIADGPHKDHAPAPQSLRLADFPLEVQERIKNAEENGIEIDLSVLHVSDGTNKPGFEKIIYNLLNDNRMTIKEVTERTGLDTAQIREIIGEQLFKKAQDNDGNELYNLLGRNE